MSTTLFLVQEAYAGGGITDVGSGAAVLIVVGAVFVVALIADMLGRKDDGGPKLDETHKTDPDQN